MSDVRCPMSDILHPTSNIRHKKLYMNHSTSELFEKAVVLLKQLISTPSFSKEENDTAELITRFLQDNGIEHKRVGNNVYAKNAHYDETKPSVLLNSHHDT